MKTFAPEDIPVAIVGMGCRLPGAATLGEFWQILTEGRYTARPLPSDRFDRELYYDPRKGVLGKSYTDTACLVDYRPLNQSVCPLPTELAACPEAAYTTICEVAAEACWHAGWNPADLPNRNAGVYIGHTRKSGYVGDDIFSTWVQQVIPILRDTAAFRELTKAQWQKTAREVVNRARGRQLNHDPRLPDLGSSMAAGIIAKGFGLTGPYMAFNSACASSLYALVHGIRSLQQDKIDVAFVGGASYCHVDTLILFSQAQSVSAGKSRPFDAEADGLIVGEGYVVLALKRLDRALISGDKIHAVIRGLGISSDGRGKSLWAPRKEGQIEAVRRAYWHEPEGLPIQYLEAHATSTQRGDATEIAALSEALAGRTQHGEKIAVASVKANVGHTLEAAGVTGLLKSVLALNQGTIPPAIHIERLNPKVNWHECPFFVPLESTPWPAPPSGQPRRAGVNAFGIGGLNIHVVVEGFNQEYHTALISKNGRGCSEAISENSNGARRPFAPAVVEKVCDAVAIIGQGAVLPGALTWSAFQDLLTTGRSAISGLPMTRWDPAVQESGSCETGVKPIEPRGGFVADFAYDWRKHKVPPRQIEQASPMQFMILDAVDQALHSAGYDRKPFDRRRVGAVVGVNFGGEFSNRLLVGLRLPELERALRRSLSAQGVSKPDIDRVCDEFRQNFLQRMPALLDETGSFTSSSLASRITKSFDLMGGAFAVDAGISASFAALECCADLLMGGDCDMLFCIGAHEDMGPTRYQAFRDRGMLKGVSGCETDKHGGCFPGEGCGVLLLKRLSAARRDGDTVYAIVRGIGSGVSQEAAMASQLSVERAIANSSLAPDRISTVAMVGSGVADIDQQQLIAIDAAYHSDATAPLPTTTLVGQIGHLVSAAGMAELLKLTSTFSEAKLPKSREYDWLGNRDVRLSRVTMPSESISLASRKDAPLAAGVHCCFANEPAYHVVLEQGDTVKLPEKDSLQFSASVNGRSRQRESAEEIIYFDATQRRREKMRMKATHKDTPTSDIPIASGAAVPELRESYLPQEDAGSHVEPFESPLDRQISADPNPPFDVGSVNGMDLEQFLINFVVEQTGYPPEIVDLDADLEADLGIDSIKKAQLFGELREFFDITPSGNLSLDDFPTLRHVFNFLNEGRRQPNVANENISQPQFATEQSASLPANAVAMGEMEHTASNRGVPRQAPADLKAFLIGFVVEQTGYPAEIVDLHADLEADLGIDSIKKAQLFGELREHFTLNSANESLSLDDFSTLGHILSFLQQLAGFEKSEDRPLTEPIAAQQVSGTAHSGNGQVIGSSKESEAELAAFLVNFVVEQTGYPPEIVDLEADLEADLGIDSIKKAQLFGELRERFEITGVGNESLSLDDFPTLRHVLHYLERSDRSSAADTFVQRY